MSFTTLEGNTYNIAYQDDVVRIRWPGMIPIEADLEISTHIRAYVDTLITEVETITISGPPKEGVNAVLLDPVIMSRGASHDWWGK